MRALARFPFLYWALQLSGWFVFFRTQATGEVGFSGAPFDRAAALWGGICLAGIALTHGLRWGARRRGWFELPPRGLILRAVAATLLMALASFALSMVLAQQIYGTPVAPIVKALYRGVPTGGLLFNQFVIIAVSHIIWVALYFSIVMQRQRHQARLRQAQLSQALQAAELQLLKAQLNPHFLFNALNSVRALIADEPARARDAVTQLAGMLRYTLAAGNEDFVSLSQELKMVEDYLALEALRLSERLAVAQAVEPAALTRRIPVMLLQTLVENAIKHGIAPLVEGGRLEIGAQVTADGLVIRVTNPHRPDAAAAEAGEMVGLKNLSERLRLLFGDAASLRLDLSTPGKAVAEVRLPA
jgi:sensor histidine kinase YesM